MAARALTGILLVGGASRRFGSPKALATFEGSTLAERAWAVLGRACEERLAFGKAADELPLPFPVHDDGLGVRAPIAGVVAGLRAARNEVCVFLPVDCPRMTPAAVRELGGACAGFDAAVPQTGPLPGAYAKSALPTLERRLEAATARTALVQASELSLRSALGVLETTIVPLHAALLANVNAPEELTAL